MALNFSSYYRQNWLAFPSNYPKLNSKQMLKFCISFCLRSYKTMQQPDVRFRHVAITKINLPHFLSCTFLLIEVYRKNTLIQTSKLIPTHTHTHTQRSMHTFTHSPPPPPNNTQALCSVLYIRVCAAIDSCTCGLVARQYVHILTDTVRHDRYIVYFLDRTK